MDDSISKVWVLYSKLRPLKSFDCYFVGKPFVRHVISCHKCRAEHDSHNQISLQHSEVSKLLPLGFWTGIYVSLVTSIDMRWYDDTR